jgi:hypothetical protein
MVNVSSLCVSSILLAVYAERIKRQVPLAHIQPGSSMPHTLTLLIRFIFHPSTA